MVPPLRRLPSPGERKRPRPRPHPRSLILAALVVFAPRGSEWSCSGVSSPPPERLAGSSLARQSAARVISAVTHDEIGGLSPDEVGGIILTAADRGTVSNALGRSRRSISVRGRRALSSSLAKLDGVGESLSVGASVPFVSLVIASASVPSVVASGEKALGSSRTGDRAASPGGKRGSVGVGFRLRFRGGNAVVAASGPTPAPAPTSAPVAEANATDVPSPSHPLQTLSERMTVAPLSLDLDNFADKVVGRSLSLLLGWAVAAQSIASLFDQTNAIESIEAASRRFLSEETASAVRTIRGILERFSEDHGVVDVLADHPPQVVVSSMLAFGRLQRAADYCETIQREGGSHGRLVGGNGNASSSTDEDAGEDESKIDQQLLSDLARYAPFANAAYGWKGGLTLFGRLHWGDERALHSKTGIGPDDILSANWHARTHRPAYFLARDADRRKLVLSIRGTFSARDVLTDLCCTAEDFWTYDDADANANADASDVKKGEARSTLSAAGEHLADALRSRQYRARAHQGMLDGARSVAKMTRQVIAAELAAYPEYDLVIVGHSLGGGTAAVLGSMWRETFPGLMVYLYGAPCVGPAGVAPASDELHIVSVVGEGDPFSRLSLGHIADISAAVARLCEDEATRGELLRRTRGDVRNMTDEDLVWCADALEELRREVMTGEKFYPPGRILYLTGAVNGGNGDSNGIGNGHGGSMGSLTLREVSEDLFRELRLHPRMLDLTRHVPSRYESALRTLWLQMSDGSGEEVAA